MRVRIEDRMEFKTKSPVLTFAADDMVMDAVQMMSEKNYGASIVIDTARRPIGVITERDFMRRLLARNLDPKITPISAIMTTDLKIARASDDVANWLRIMSNERFRHLPVVDADGVLINVMSQGDFVSYTWPQLFAEIRTMTSESFAKKYQLYFLALAFAIYILVVVAIAKV